MTHVFKASLRAALPALSVGLALAAALGACAGNAGTPESSGEGPTASGSLAQTVPITPPASAPIETKYYARGPWSAVLTTTACCDRFGTGFKIWYPQNLGFDASGAPYRHPIVTFGDGTGQLPDNYAAFLDHLASWGFVVIAVQSKVTGGGQGIADAASYMVAQNGAASSPFRGKLAPEAVAAVGHSQGAWGVLNAMIDSPTLISTAVSIELPARAICLADGCPSSTKLTQGSVFFVNGSLDTTISPSFQNNPCLLAGQPNEQSNSCYYANTPVSSKTWITLIGANHGDVMGQPGCPATSSPGSPCANGVYGYLGYPTAWLAAMLQHDATALSAFHSPTGEALVETTNWQNQISGL
jgi:hypothetical protein